MLYGRADFSMSQFSSGMDLREIEREIANAVNSSFSTKQEGARDSYICLKMINKLLPQDLAKVLSLVTTKYSKRGTPSDDREIAAAKCLIDFRIRFLELTGKAKEHRKYVHGALDLHKSLNSRSVDAVNQVLEEWTQRVKL